MKIFLILLCIIVFPFFVYFIARIIVSAILDGIDNHITTKINNLKNKKNETKKNEF